MKKIITLPLLFSFCSVNCHWRAAARRSNLRGLERGRGRGRSRPGASPIRKPCLQAVRSNLTQAGGAETLPDHKHISHALGETKQPPQTWKCPSQLAPESACSVSQAEMPRGWYTQESFQETRELALGFVWVGSNSQRTPFFPSQSNRATQKRTA